MLASQNATVDFTTNLQFMEDHAHEEYQARLQQIVDLHDADRFEVQHTSFRLLQREKAAIEQEWYLRLAKMRQDISKVTLTKTFLLIHLQLKHHGSKSATMPST
jgi:hypothetical protein